MVHPVSLADLLGDIVGKPGGARGPGRALAGTPGPTAGGCGGSGAHPGSWRLGLRLGSKCRTVSGRAACISALHMLFCSLEYLSIFKSGQLLLTLQSPASAFLKCSRQNWPSPPWNSLSPVPIRLSGQGAPGIGDHDNTPWKVQPRAGTQCVTSDDGGRAGLGLKGSGLQREAGVPGAPRDGGQEEQPVAVGMGLV